MSIQQSINKKLTDGLTPVHLEVINESHMHHVPPNSETHFKVIVVASQFKDKPLVQRHRVINDLLAYELRKSVHALSIHTLTPDEWKEKGGNSSKTPACKGGFGK